MKVKFATALLGAIAMAFILYASALRLTGHTVVKGEVYRAAQVDPNVVTSRSGSPKATP